MIEEGTQAPDFELKDDAGNTVRLSDYRGQPVVLYFYPKDDTPGCTKEACDLRDNYSEFRERGAVILGVIRNILTLINANPFIQIIVIGLVVLLAVVIDKVRQRVSIQA